MDAEQASNWSELRVVGQTKPSRRSHHSAVLFSEHMYIYGGRGAWNEKLGDVWMYVFEHECWQTLPKGHVDDTPPPVPRSHHTASIHGDLMYVFGGQTEGCVCSNELLVLEMNEMRWTTGPSVKKRRPSTPPSPRDSHSAVCLDSMLVIIGGIDDSGVALGEVHCCELPESYWTEMKPVGAAPPKRFGHSCVATSTEDALIFGGCGFTGEKLNDLWSLNIQTQEWREIDVQGTPPRERFGHSASVHGSVMVVFGGTLESSEATNDLFYLGIGGIHSGAVEWRRRQADTTGALAEHSSSKTHRRTSVGAVKIAPANVKTLMRLGRRSRPRVMKASSGRTEDDTMIMKELFGIDLLPGRTSGVGGRPAPLEHVEGRAPCARDGHSAVVYDGMVFIFGGEKNPMKLDDLFVYKV